MFSPSPTPRLTTCARSGTSTTLMRGRLLLLMALGLGLGIAAAAEGTPDVMQQPRTTIPTEKPGPDHERFLKVAKAGGVDVLFLGDSITAHWRIEGRPVWEKYFAPLKAANFGIGGDRTENVIWRLRHGELEGIQPKLVVLLIGINNGPDSVADVALGIKTIIADINERSPSSRILLLGIFPAGHGPHVAGMGKQAQVNAITATYADNRRVVFKDIGEAFLSPERMLEKDVMPDFVHLSEKGYQIWADAIHDTVEQLLAQALVPSSDVGARPLPTTAPAPRQP
jgi:lysophospholipase L1-like esterase